MVAYIIVMVGLFFTLWRIEKDHNRAMNAWLREEYKLTYKIHPNGNEYHITVRRERMPRTIKVLGAVQPEWLFVSLEPMGTTEPGHAIPRQRVGI